MLIISTGKQKIILKTYVHTDTKENYKIDHRMAVAIWTVLFEERYESL